MFDRYKAKREDEPEPEDIFRRMDDNSMKVGLLMKEFVETAAFQALMDLLEKRRLEIGDRALTDDKRPREYYQGFRAGATSLQALMVDMVQHASDIETKRAHEYNKDAAAETLRTHSGEPVE